MPFLGIAKQRPAETLESSATHGEGAQNLLCAYLAGAVFLALAALLVARSPSRRELRPGAVRAAAADAPR